MERWKHLAAERRRNSSNGGTGANHNLNDKNRSIYVLTKESKYPLFSFSVPPPLSPVR